MKIAVLKTGFLRSLVLATMISTFGYSTKAQLSFPNGNVLNLNTTNDFLYEETRILFNTGIYKVEDYSWEKILDSIDSKWFVTSCFNGECRNEIEQSGSFLNDYGINDTTCFIAFHVETYQYTGSSVIRYKVYNRKNAGDTAHLIFDIAYTKLVGLNHKLANELEVYPNPASESMNLQLNEDLKNAEIWIVNLQGETLFRQSNNKSIDVTFLAKGVYFLQVLSGDKIITQRFVKI